MRSVAADHCQSKKRTGACTSPGLLSAPFLPDTLGSGWGASWVRASAGSSFETTGPGDSGHKGHPVLQVVGLVIVERARQVMDLDHGRRTVGQGRFAARSPI
jgi:hypothetical protein